MSPNDQITVKKSAAAGGGAVVELQGELDFESVPGMLSDLQSVVRDNADVTLSLAGVVSANSAALALLIELRRTAQQTSHELSISNLPISILKIASVCEAQELLEITS